MTALACYALFLVLGATASYQDWTTRKIRNRLVLLGLAGAAAALAVMLLNSALGHAGRRLGPLGEFYLPWRFYPRLALHVLLSLVAALALWRAAVWPAGDAKLYALFAVLVALAEPNLPGFPSWLFLLLLINVFVPAGLLFAVETAVKLAARAPALARADWRVGAKAWAETLAIRLGELWPRRGEWLVLGVNLYALFLGLQFAQARLLRGVQEPLRSLGVFVVMMTFWPFLAAVLRRRAVGAAAFAAVVAGAAAGLLLRPAGLGRLFADALRMTFNFGLFLSVGRLVVARAIEWESLRELNAEQLESGTVLSDRSWAAVASEKALSGRLGFRYVDGLSAEDAQALRSWSASGGASGYTVYRTIPFALWIFFGSLLTLSGRVNSVALIAPWLARGRDLLWALARRLLG